MQSPVTLKNQSVNQILAILNNLVKPNSYSVEKLLGGIHVKWLKNI